MERLTVGGLLTIHSRINTEGVIPAELMYVLGNKFRDFNRSWGKQAKEWSEKLNDLYKEMYVFEGDRIKEEDIFEERTKSEPKKLLGIKIGTKVTPETVKTGSKPVLTGKLTEEEFNKKRIELLSTEVKSW